MGVPLSGEALAVLRAALRRAGPAVEELASRVFPRADRASAGVFVPARGEQAARAVRALEQGATPQQLWEDHFVWQPPGGVEFGRDRFATEVSDRAARVLQPGEGRVSGLTSADYSDRPTRLADIYDHPELWEYLDRNAPDIAGPLRELPVHIRPGSGAQIDTRIPDRLLHSGDPPTTSIQIGRDQFLDRPTLHGAVAHEVDHAIGLNLKATGRHDLNRWAPGGIHSRIEPTPQNVRAVRDRLAHEMTLARKAADDAFRDDPSAVNRARADLAHQKLLGILMMPEQRMRKLAQYIMYFDLPGERRAYATQVRADWPLGRRLAIHPDDTEAPSVRDRIIQNFISGAAAGGGIGVAGSIARNALRREPQGSSA